MFIRNKLKQNYNSYMHVAANYYKQKLKNKLRTYLVLYSLRICP